jgi:hypothetical protein
MAEENLTWFAGVDWGSERHQACLLDAQGNIVAEREFPASRGGLCVCSPGRSCRSTSRRQLVISR